LISEAGIKELENIGVRDSKMLSSARRAELYEKITAVARCNVIKIGADQLDLLMSKRSLNEIEADHFAQVIENLTPDTAYIDAADVRCSNFERMILKHLSSRPNLIVEHKADERYPVVSAASIIAKVERDRAIKELHKIHGDFGSGYTSDERTQRFIKRCFAENKSFPDCVRKRWKTTVRASNLKLDDF
jgi:ribonuclease HII